MTKRELHLLGRICAYIYGDRWQAPLSRDLKLNERTVRAWVGGRSEMAPKTWLQIREVLDRKIKRAPIMRQRVDKFIRTLPKAA